MATPEILRKYPSRSSINDQWNPDFKTFSKAGRWLVTRWKSGTPGGAVNNCEHASVTSPRQLTKAEIAQIEKKTSLKNGSCFGVRAPNLNRVQVKIPRSNGEFKRVIAYRYEWCFNHGTD